MGEHSRSGRIAWLITLSIFSTTAFAQAWTKEPATVLGIRFDEPFHASNIPTCNKDAPKGQMCFVDVGMGMFYRTPDLGFPYLAKLFRSELDGSSEVSGLLITTDHANYGDMKSAMIEKYGPPQRTETKSLQNGFGAKFSSEQLRWYGTRIILTIDERSSSINETLVSFMSTKYARRMDEKQSQATRSGLEKF